MENFLFFYTQHPIIDSLKWFRVMHTVLYLAALASVVYSQLINLDKIALDFAPPELVTAPLNVESDIPATLTADAVDPLQSVSTKKRELIEKRDGDCSPYPAGSGPVPNPDSPSAFLSDPEFSVYIFFPEYQKHLLTVVTGYG